MDTTNIAALMLVLVPAVVILLGIFWYCVRIGGVQGVIGLGWMEPASRKILLLVFAIVFFIFYPSLTKIVYNNNVSSTK